MSQETVNPQSNAETALIKEVMSLVSEGGKAVNRADKENIVLILGSTGSGKSTAINYLVGCQMIEAEDPDTGMITINCSDSVADIGDGTISKTLYPNVVDFLHPEENYKFRFVDTAGFSDNRGAAHDICASSCLGRVFKIARSILGVIVLIQESDIMDTRLNKVLSFFKQLNQCLSQESFSGCITFFISKSFMKRTTKQIYNLMNKAYNELDKEEANQNIQDIKWIFEEFLAGNGKNIHICDPLIPEGRKPLLDVIRNLHTVKDKSSAFKYPLSAETLLCVSKIVKELEGRILNRLGEVLKEYKNSILLQIRSIASLEDAFKNRVSWLDEYDKAVLDYSRPGSGPKSMTAYISLLTRYGLNAANLKDKGYLYDDLKAMLDQYEILGAYVNGDNLFREETFLDVTRSQIKDFREEMNLVKAKYLGVDLNNIMTDQEVQSIVREDGIKEKYLSLSLKDDYSYQAEDFEILYSKGVSREALGTNLKELFSLGEKGQKVIQDAVKFYLLNPFVIIKDGNKLIVQAKAGHISIHSVVKEIKSMAGLTYDELWILARYTVYMDDDIGMSVASGRNVVIACEDIRVSNNAKINVSGYSLDASAPPVNVIYGQNGGNAGNIHLYVTGLIGGIPLTLVANGGNGGSGISGAKGATGAKGEDGTDAGYTDYFGGAIDHGDLRTGVAGTKGGKGGKGIDAGSGGLGGRKGGIYIYPNDQPAAVNKTQLDGNKGRDGNTGEGGDGGAGGYNGYTTLSYSMSGVDKTVYFTGYFTKWSSHFENLGFSYKVGLDDGIGVEGKTGPSRTYASCGDKGERGSVLPTPVSLLASLPVVEMNAVKTAYEKLYKEV